jgi:hypothetical protein
MAYSLFSFIRKSIDAPCQAVERRLRHWTRPENRDLVLNAVLDMTRSKSEVVLENALLRQQLIVLKRGEEETVCWLRITSAEEQRVRTCNAFGRLVPSG